MKKNRKIWTKIVLCACVASLLVATFAISASAWTGFEDENGDFNNIYCVVPLAEVLVQSNGYSNNRNVNVNNVLSTNKKENGVIVNALPNTGDILSQSYGEYSWSIEKLNDTEYLHSTTVDVAVGCNLTKHYANVTIPYDEKDDELPTNILLTNPYSTKVYCTNWDYESYYPKLAYSAYFYLNGKLCRTSSDGIRQVPDYHDNYLYLYELYDLRKYVVDAVKIYNNGVETVPDNNTIFIEYCKVTYDVPQGGHIIFNRLYKSASTPSSVWSSTPVEYDVDEIINRNEYLEEKNSEILSENAELKATNSKLNEDNDTLTSENAELKTAYKDAKEGLDNSNAVLNFFQGIYEAIQGTLNTFFELEVFGFSLGNIVAILLGAAIVIIILKLVL